MMKNQGRSKLTEECGELIQVLGKIDAYGVGKHPDGLKNLGERLVDEIADVEAAIAFVKYKMKLDGKKIKKRKQVKLELYHKWDRKKKKNRRFAGRKLS